eukprot:evm.model.scf_1898.2 EVM.evm.TU.scf_1898.2   scf_1898:13164-14337(-)
MTARHWITPNLHKRVLQLQCAANAGRKHKKSNSGKGLRRSHSGRAKGKVAQKISAHELLRAESPRIRAVHPACEHGTDVWDLGLERLFKEERQAAPSLLADDKLYMGLEILFDEHSRRGSDSFGRELPFGQVADAAIDGDWDKDFGLCKLFQDGADKTRPWVARVAATGAAISVPIFVWALRRCVQAGCRNTL